MAVQKAGWALHTVSTIHLKSKSVFKLSRPGWKHYVWRLPEGAKQHVSRSFCLTCIIFLPTAIVETRSGEEVRMGRYFGWEEISKMIS